MANIQDRQSLNGIIAGIGTLILSLSVGSLFGGVWGWIVVGIVMLVWPMYSWTVIEFRRSYKDEFYR